MSDRIFRGALGAALLLLLGACSENVTGSLGCPSLCADESATLRDTVLVGAIAYDTTLTGFPLLGETRELSLVARGDTADVRIITRFDTLPQRYTPPTPQPDSLIARVDSANLIFRIDTAFVKPTIPLTIEAYDVDTTANDTIPQTLLPLFRQDKLLGSRTYQVNELGDTLRLPLSSDVLLGKVRNNQRLRIGLKLSGSSSATLRISGSSFSPRVRFRVSADTTVAPDTVFLNSRTPTTDAAVAASLVMYRLVASGALPPPPNTVLALGGLAGARAYMRFEIPSIVIDSVQVIRASLQLTQLTSRSTGGAKDTLTVITLPVTAGPAITDPFTASQFLATPGLWPVDTLRLLPSASGTRNLEIVNIVRAWRAVEASKSTRALVLRVVQEGSSPGELDFSSMHGPVASRPSLRLTYVPRRGFGIP
ncbi:MAG: hypothetical protein ACJ8AD_19065 [Gemmatimonadaceae bacterium]